mgnify:CR=1 FL=1
MDKIKIKGGRQLNGEIFISGAKNAALPLICASLLTEETVTLTNMPILSDIKSMNLLLEQLGTQIDSFDDFVDGHPTKTYSYRTPKLTSIAAPYDYVRKMRASYYVLGPLLARAGKVELPGGGAIGTRPMDIHLAAMEEMGAKIDIRNGYVYGEVDGRLKGAHIVFRTVSVGATCNVLMAATLADGITVLENAAKEPEIGDLINLLNDMGAKISGIGTSILTIEGVEKLHGARHKVIPDRIEAGSYAVAAAITGGKIELINAQTYTLKTPMQILQKMGVEVVDTETFADKDTDFSAQLTKIQASNPDVIAIAGLYQEGSLIVKKAREMGMTQPIIGNNGFNSPAYITQAGAAADGTLVATPWNADRQTEKAQAFRKAFVAKYNHEPDQFAAQAYDAMYLIHQAVEQSGTTTDRKKFRDTLAQIKGFEGATGKFEFDANRDPKMDLDVLQVKEGKWVPFA